MKNREGVEKARSNQATVCSDCQAPLGPGYGWGRYYWKKGLFPNFEHGILSNANNIYYRLQLFKGPMVVRKAASGHVTTLMQDTLSDIIFLQ